MSYIRSRYKGRCNICGGYFKAGEPIWWVKGNRKATAHEHCHKTKGNTDGNYTGYNRAKNPPKDGDFLDYTVNYRELTEKYKKMVSESPEDSTVVKYSRGTLRILHDGWVRGTKFYGCNAEDVKRWISVGYKPELMKNSIPMPSELQPRRKLRLKDEGELDLESFLSGFDYPYLAWDKRPAKPSMRINIDMSFVCSTPAKIIEEYLVWCAKVIKKLEIEGVDCEIRISSRVKNLIENDYRMHRTNITVKKQNEKFTFSSWSAMVSPGGYRHLVFAANLLFGEHHKAKVRSGLGTGVDSLWNVEWDVAKREMNIRCPFHPGNDFPEEMMEAKFKETLELAKK